MRILIFRLYYISTLLSNGSSVQYPSACKHTFADCYHGVDEVFWERVESFAYRSQDQERRVGSCSQVGQRLLKIAEQCARGFPRR